MRISASVLFAATAALGLTSLGSAQQRLPRECRQEIRQLCDGDRSEIRECLREKASELSKTCRAELRDRMRTRRGSEAPRPSASGSATAIAYGTHARQQIDFYSAKTKSSEPAPLILFIHGGGWSFGNHKSTVQSKPDHFTANGFAFAATGYRLLPDHPVEQQAEDIGSAIKALRAQATTLGFDPDRIVLMGHSAGAHLAALVATDPRYSGEDMSAIQGVVLLDGAGYDVVTSMQDAGAQGIRLYRNAFGEDLARQAALSPITHVGTPDAPDWLILFVEGRARSAEQSQALTLALREAGAMAEALPIANTDHGKLNRELGTPGDPATVLVDAFVDRVTAG